MHWNSFNLALVKIQHLKNSPQTRSFTVSNFYSAHTVSVTFILGYLAFISANQAIMPSKDM